MRKRTGLRNKFRSGQGAYSRNRKRQISDSYGSYDRGVRSTPEVVAGHTVQWKLNTKSAPKKEK